MTTTRQIATYNPSLLGRAVLDDLFGDIFSTEFPNYLRQSTQGYPVADIYRGEDGATIMEFALAGFSRSELTVNISPEKRSITVSADSGDEDRDGRRIARRSFTKTFVNYDNSLDLARADARFENGLLTVEVPPRPEVKPITIDIQ
jgi:HSP20 family molecular chaperone IbpA